MHTSRCLGHVADIRTLALPRSVESAGREVLDFSTSGPFSTRVVLEVLERFGFVIVGSVPVVARVFYNRRDGATDVEDVRLALDLSAVGPLRVLVPGDARVVIHAASPGFDVWLDDLRALDRGKDRT
jgi:hypothetical protein